VNGIAKEQQTAGAQTHRHFTQEFKLEAVRLPTLGDRSVSQVARELGIRGDTLN
jgi:transposase-like protein